MKNQSFRSLFLTIILFAFLFSNCEKGTDTDTQMPAEGLVAYYPFNGNALDESPLANNGSVSGAQLAEDRNNADFSAFYFDGVDDYIEVPSIGAINFGTDQEFAISIWLKYEKSQPNSTNVDNDVLAKWVKGGSTDGKGYPFCLRITNQKSDTPGEWYGTRWDSDACGHGGGAGSAGKVCGDGKWHHIVYMKTSTVVIAYIDGEQADQGTDNTSCETKNDAPLLIGLRSKSGGNAFNGYVDDLRIYNRSLSAEEIKQLFEE